MDAKKYGKILNMQKNKIGKLNNYLLTGTKVPHFFTETNSRYFIVRDITRPIIKREFVEVKKRHFLPVNT